MANTVTDGNGNYQFGSVQPGTYFVRWNLASVTTNFLITTAIQGGDMGGFVSTMGIGVLAGTTNLSVNLGLVESLPVVKAAALADLAAALETSLEANYTAENWTMLNTAKTAGDIAINAATDPAGVATAMAAALAAMEAVPMMGPNTYIWTAVEIGWNTLAGTNYQVQATTNLQSGPWQNFGGVTVGNGSLMSVFDSTRTNAARFYRVLQWKTQRAIPPQRQQYQ